MCQIIIIRFPDIFHILMTLVMYIGLIKSVTAKLFLLFGPLGENVVVLFGGIKDVEYVVIAIDIENMFLLQS